MAEKPWESMREDFPDVAPADLCSKLYARRMVLSLNSPLTTRIAAFAFALLAVAPGMAAPAGTATALPACVPCHGMDGIGRDVEIPNLAGQNEAYLLNQLRAFRQGRRAHKEMLYMSRNMTDEDMKALAAYFAALPPR